MVDQAEKQAVEMRQMKESLNLFAEKVNPLAKQVLELQALCERNLQEMKAFQQVAARFANAEKMLKGFLKQMDALPGQMKANSDQAHAFRKMLDEFPRLCERVDQAEAKVKDCARVCEHDEQHVALFKDQLQKQDERIAKGLKSLKEKVADGREDCKQQALVAQERLDGEALQRKKDDVQCEKKLRECEEKDSDLQRQLEGFQNEVLKVYHRMEDMKKQNAERDERQDNVLKDLYEKVNPVASLRNEVRNVKQALQDLKNVFEAKLK